MHLRIVPTYEEIWESCSFSSAHKIEFDHTVDFFIYLDWTLYQSRLDFKFYTLNQAHFGISVSCPDTHVYKEAYGFDDPLIRI